MTHLPFPAFQPHVVYCPLYMTERTLSVVFSLVGVTRGRKLAIRGRPGRENVSLMSFRPFLSNDGAFDALDQFV